MKDNRLEQKFRSNFETHRPQLDHDQLWNDIEPHLNKKRDKGFPFWLFGVGVIVLLGTSALLFSVRASEEAIPQVAASLNTLSNSLIEAQVNPQLTSTETKSLLNKNKNVHVSSSVKVIENQPSKAISSKNQLVAVPENNAITTTAILSDISTFVKSSKQTNTTTNNKLTSSAPTLPVINSQTIINPKKQLLKINELSQKWTEFPLGLPLNLGLLQKKNLYFESAIGSSPLIELKKKLPTLIHFYASPDYTFNVLKNKDSDTELAAIRQQSEKPLESFSAGLNIQRQYQNGFLWTIGMDYRQINTKLEVRQKIVDEIILKDGVISVIEDPLGKPTIYQVGEKPATQITIQEKDVYNNYISLNLPIGVGYHFKTRRAHMQLMSGLDINIFNLSYGELLNEFGQTNRLNSLVDGSPQFYKRNTGLGLWLAASYAQPIGQHWSVFASPYFRYQLGSTTVSDYGLIQKQHGLGARVGMRYHVPQKQ